MEPNVLSLVPIQRDLFIQGMFTEISEVEGSLAKFDLDSGIPLTKSMLVGSAEQLSGTGSNAALSIPRGMVAVSLPISRLSSVSYAPQSGVLQGITRDSVLTIALDLGYEIREAAIPREMLYLADEAFFCGTAVEVTPVRSIDRILVGDGARGPVTAAIQRHFFGIITGDIPDTHRWLTPVPSAVAR